MDFQTAVGAYGFLGTPSGDASVKGETSVGVALDTPKGAAEGPLPLHWGNPLFWLLILVLIFTGWVFGGFNFGARGGVRKVGSAGGSVRVRGGR